MTDRVHETSWSANLEKTEQGEDRELSVQQSTEAVEHTAPGSHVNLVTHETHGHPSEYLYAGLDSEFACEDVDCEYVDRCGCVGHVVLGLV